MDKVLLNGYESLKQTITQLANVRMDFLNEMPKTGNVNKKLSMVVDKSLNTAIADLANLGNLLGDIHNSNSDEFDTELLIRQFEESQRLAEQAL